MAAEVVQFDRADEPKATRAQSAQKRRRLEFSRRMATAQTPLEKLSAAADYFRATAADHRVPQTKADIATEHHVERLIASADQLANTIRRNR